MKTKLSQRQEREIESEIARIFHSKCSGIELRMLDLPKVMRAGKDAHHNGQSVEDAVITTVQSLRTN